MVKALFHLLRRLNTLLINPPLTKRKLSFIQLNSRQIGKRFSRKSKGKMTLYCRGYSWSPHFFVLFCFHSYLHSFSLICGLYAKEGLLLVDSLICVLSFTFEQTIMLYHYNSSGFEFQDFSPPKMLFPPVRIEYPKLSFLF